MIRVNKSLISWCVVATIICIAVTSIQKYNLMSFVADACWRLCLAATNIFVIAGYVDHVIGSHMSIDIYPPDDSGEPVNGWIHSSSAYSLIVGW